MANKPNVSLSLESELERALQWTLEQMEQTKKEAPDWHVGYYFSASDLERRVRARAAEIADGKEYGTYKNYGGGVRILGLEGYTLLEHCREFLARQVSKGRLRADNPTPGRHSSSGLRFRPAENDLTEAEKRTRSVPEKERYRRIVHFDPSTSRLYIYISKGNPLCLSCRKPTTPRGFNWRRSQRRASGHPEEVTCKTCQKMLKKLQHPLVPELQADVELGVLADWLEEHNRPEEAAVYRQKMLERAGKR